MKKPNNGPVYAAAMYTGLAKIARKHGYALAAHGSLARDFDLLCIPWIEYPSSPEAVVEEITSTYAVGDLPDNPGIKLHGRKVWTLTIGFGECFLDLSFMPCAAIDTEASHG